MSDRGVPMQRSDLPVPTSGILATHFVVARDIDTTARFYSEVLGGEVVVDGKRIGPGAPTYVKFANIWIIVNVGGAPTPDKPEVVLDVHENPNRFDTFLNLRVADIHAVYREWRGRGAEFLTPPLDNHGYELRCYLRDPDGRIIEVGQPTGFLAYLGIENTQ
jgi:catechol 2,3-dioxygenase-like lactoylglutathione lyase family enzyme